MGTEPFTWGRYEEYLSLALDSGYRFQGFDSLGAGPPPPSSTILLRHDVDYDPAWVGPMAALEERVGAIATYCFLLDSGRYALGDGSTDEVIEDLLGRGHRLGLHYDATVHGGDDEVIAEIAKHVATIEGRFGSPVEVVSFHMPTRREVGHLELPGGLINAYGPRFFGEIGYASDSNQSWRGVDLAQLLRDRTYECLQLLIHPFWWRERYEPMLDKLRRLCADLGLDESALITTEQLALAAADGQLSPGGRRAR